jgi:hypothetical protein
VLLRQVRPSMVPDLKDSMDVSNFDVMFTSDKSWKHSALLRGSTNKDADDAEEHDPFADFHYVSRPLMDRASDRFSSNASQGTVRQAGRAPARRYDVMEKGRESMDSRQSTTRNSKDSICSPKDSKEEFGRSKSLELTMPSEVGRLSREKTGRLSRETLRRSTDELGNPCSPWHPCENGCQERERRKKSGRYI